MSPSLNFLRFSKLTYFSRQSLHYFLSSLVVLSHTYLFLHLHFLFWRRSEQSCSQLRMWPTVAAGICLTSFLSNSLHSSFLSDCQQVLNRGCQRMTPQYL